MKIQTDFPAVLDDTILAKYGQCPWKANLSECLHYKAKDKSTHLIAGGAYAAGLEALRLSFYVRKEPLPIARGHAAAAAIREYGDHETDDKYPNKSLDRVLSALDYYCKWRNPATDIYKPMTFSGDVPGIEFNFAVEIPHPNGGPIPHPVTGDPLLFTGRSDAVLQNPDGALFLLDDKTESQLGATWQQKWRLRSQFTGYFWAARQLGIPITAILIRGMCFYRAIQSKTGTFFHGKEATSTRTEHDCQVWLSTTQQRILRFIRDWEENQWELALGDACNAYGGCQFKHICTSKQPELWLNQDFRRARWNPLKRRLDPIES